ncbi:MAG: hypothetical protein Q8J59_05120 [Methylotenera sp.]|uniref:DUF6731 family protein n=1 Tax=Methylotenera sp. TaxID=2051956 RepID=UPI0027351DC1|nr:DUF6731 family protein [Methylotenera sp.]MDP2102091.1 hypothetical protein [Methylotenera sp.]MDP2281051.1 hypothetical protein [Methylotenera sp.]MDP3061146.1 hypothetical protein [Methylotenera sp.]MDP3210915.1 hypothetical protein [Methylotenera sp.]
MSNIKVYFFSISSQSQARPLQEIFEELQLKGISQRTYSHGQFPVRLENILPLTLAGRNYWLLKFSKLRDTNWPGVAEPNAEATDLILDDTSLLTEDTYTIFDLENGKVAVQYNHFGVRISKVQDYINVMGNSPFYNFIPVLNQNVLNKYESKPIITKVHAVIDGLSDADIAIFNGSSLSQSINQSLEADVQRIEFSISVDARYEEMKIQKHFAKDLIDRVLGRQGPKDSLKVSVKDEDNSTIEILDLFEDLKISYIDSTSLNKTAGRRYDSTGFNNALISVMNEWH